MTTKTRAATIGIVAAALTVMLAYSAFILPASAQQAPSTTTTSSSATSTSTSGTSPPSPPGPQGHGGGWFFQAGPGRGGPFGQQAQVSLSVGQTITITSTSGEYMVASNHSENGTASGTLTFTVTGKLSEGYTLSITSGSLVVGSTTYTVTSGSAQMGPNAAQMEGQGATSSSGVFLLSASAHGSFAGSSATVSLDLSSGSSEYLVFLSGNITG